MNSRQKVISCINMTCVGELPHDITDYTYVKSETDFIWTGMSPSPDDRPSNAYDEWGAYWENIGTCGLGEVKKFPLTDWDDFDSLKIPDVTLPERFAGIRGIREKYPDKFILASGVSLYERVHFIRSLEETWVDIYENPDELVHLIDILVEMNLYVIEQYAAEDIDALILWDDWGLQDRLMIDPQKWREIWMPAYKRVFDSLHSHGMKAFLHSCGYITPILDDLIEIGLDVVHMDQQENMGLQELHDRFCGRLTFYAPVDIQQTLPHGSLDDIKRYCKQMFDCLATDKGGFIPRCYTDPIGAGLPEESVKCMCEEFHRLNELRK